MNEPEYKSCRKCDKQYPNNAESFHMRKGKPDTICRECQHEYDVAYRRQHPKKEHETSRAEMVSLVIKVCRAMQEERDIKAAKVRRKKWLEWEKQNANTKGSGRINS